MFSSNYPEGFNDGVSILNMPIQPLVGPVEKIIWVDANADKNSDGTYREPYATIAAAMVNAKTGDTIKIAAGHTENLTVVATLPVPIAIRVTSDGADTGRTFTITGTNRNGQPISEAITGPGSTTTDGSTLFKTVTNVAVDAATAGEIKIGSATDDNGICKAITPGSAINIPIDGDYATAVGFNVSTAGLTIKGMGEGQRIPTFTSTVQLGAVMITAANTVLENLKFVANVTDVVQAIDLTLAADGTVIRNCVFRDSGAALDFLIHIDVATTVTELVVEGCDFTTAAGGMTSSIFFTGTSSNVVIRNNVFDGDCSASIIDHLADDCLNVLIHGNRMVNHDGAASLGLSLKSNGSSTGQVFDNYILVTLNGALCFAVTTDFFVAENYVANSINASGVLQPAAVSL